MLEVYFLKPTTVDRIRESWLAEPIEQYVAWLDGKGYAPSVIKSRVPVLRQFAEFVQNRGGCSFDELPVHIEPFVECWVETRGPSRSAERLRQFRNEIRHPVEQLVSLLLPSFSGRGRAKTRQDPFLEELPGFFPYLRQERGLREETIRLYFHYLRSIEAYLGEVGVERLNDLSPAILSAFVTVKAQTMHQSCINTMCSCLRVLLRFAHRQGVVESDLSMCLETPRTYGKSKVPRSITWDEVRVMLEQVDCRSPVGKRDYAILLLLVTYGLRAHEVQGLTLDDLDWERGRLLVPERKAGHCTAYPLSNVVAEAVIDYLKNARPDTPLREVFLRALAPVAPLGSNAVSQLTTTYLRQAGIRIHRPGSHTLRHTCVQRLIDARFPLKSIGDYVGHRSPRSTEIYSKVDIQSLRDIAQGDGEQLI